MDRPLGFVMPANVNPAIVARSSAMRRQVDAAQVVKSVRHREAAAHQVLDESLCVSDHLTARKAGPACIA